MCIRVLGKTDIRPRENEGSRWGFGTPKRGNRAQPRPFPRDMVPARARYENNATDQRYHNVVDRAGNEMRNLSVQIRTVFSTVGIPQG